MSKYQDMLRELIDVDAGLTGWEMDFLDSLCGQGYLDDDHLITEKQANKLEQIWNRIFK
jgi:hypothetical protein